MPDPVLPNLRQCLEAASWRRLLAMMACHGLPCSTRWLKADLVAALHAHLLDAATWRQRIPELGAPARSALDTLVQAGGALPAPTFQETFGAVRPYRPWRDDAPAQVPWEAPGAPAERLWYLGLLYFDPPAAGPGIERSRASSTPPASTGSPSHRTSSPDAPGTAASSPDAGLAEVWTVPCSLRIRRIAGATTPATARRPATPLTTFDNGLGQCGQPMV